MAFNTITTVKTAATSYDLTTLANVKDELDITSTDDDAWLSRAITQSSKAIANFCNRVFSVETVIDTCLIEQDPYPYQVPGGVRVLQLSRLPIISVTSVVQTVSAGVTNTLTEGTDFLIDGLKGQLIRLSPFSATPTIWGAITTVVTYQAGYSDIPADLELSCLRLVTQRYKEQARDPMLRRREQPGLGTEEYWVGTVPGQQGAMPPEIVSLLDGTYRVPVVG
jgi:hypothetical protein